MLHRLFPRQIDNVFRGHRAGLWLFVPIVVLRLLQGVNSLAMPRMIMADADGIPVATFAPDAARVVTSLFALLGADRVVLATAAIVALVRYRAMVPMVYALLLFEMALKSGVLALHPTGAQTATAGFVVTWLLRALMVTGFTLSMWRPRAVAVS